MKRNPIPNSKPFEKGKSGNPNGRPKVLPQLKESIAKVLDDVSADGRLSALEAILISLRKRAINGDNAAAKILLEYAYGKPKQQIELTGDVEINVPSYVLPDGTKFEL